MSRKSPNPRKIPRTQADVDRAEEQGRITGMEFMATVAFWILLDKHSAQDDEVQVFAEEIRYLMDSIAKGYVSYPDIVRAMREEHNTTVCFH